MSTQKRVLQEFGTVEENSLRLETEKAEQIIDALNTDLAAGYTLYHQLKKHHALNTDLAAGYTLYHQLKKHHWNVEGAEFRDLHLFLGEAAEHAEEATDEIAERAQALGGTPVASMENLAEHSPVEAEDEDVYDIRTSLENLLREILVQTEEDAHHIEHYLEDDTLVTESALR
ncbi:DNA starvation/stationary phase protection protein [Halobacteriales archaeon SW_10_66_29]|nr:MAG: DNA starvation/stationary phase protection protein [Halobacteriales archaeon SW_10_66_29]